MNINELRLDIAKRNKKGIHFILASIVLWTAVLIVWKLPIEDIFTRNLLTFCCTTPLMPLAFFISKIIKAEFSAKDNPLNNLGLLFSVNQLVYLLIAMWVYAASPSNLVMIIAMIFGAHLMPFGWLYMSKYYTVLSVVIPIAALIVGHSLSVEQVYIIPAMMIGFEIAFSIWLAIENKKLLISNKHRMEA